MRSVFLFLTFAAAGCGSEPGQPANGKTETQLSPADFEPHNTETSFARFVEEEKRLSKGLEGRNELFVNKAKQDLAKHWTALDGKRFEWKRKLTHINKEGGSVEGLRYGKMPQVPPNPQTWENTFNFVSGTDVGEWYFPPAQKDKEWLFNCKGDEEVIFSGAIVKLIDTNNIGLGRRISVLVENGLLRRP